MFKFLSPKFASSARLLSCSHLAMRYATTSTAAAIVTSRIASMSPTTGYSHSTANMLLANRPLLKFSVRLYSPELPSHSAVALPALSPTMQKGNIVSWKKKEGDKLDEGDLLCEIETDKAIMGYETPEEGYLAKIVLPEGTKDVPIGKLLCIIVPEKSDVAAFANFVAPEGGEVAAAPAPPKPQTAAPSPPPPQTRPAAPASTPAPPAPKPQMAPTIQQGRVVATPYARKLAAEKGVDLQIVAGSGPGGRILAQDIMAAPKGVREAARAPTAAAARGPMEPSVGAVDVPLSDARKVMAQRAIASKISIPHYYLSSLICLDEILRVKSRINKLLSKDKEGVSEITLNDFVLKAAAIACTRLPEANSFFMETFIRQNNNVDISVGLRTDSGETVYPVLFDAHIKGLVTINKEINAMKAKAKEGTFSSQETEGGTFAVSYMGEYASVHNFSAIIIPPQSCHLAIGHPNKQLVPDGDGGYKESTLLNVTLSCDHRVVDGALGAQWLKHYKDLLEKPHTMLL